MQSLNSWRYIKPLYLIDIALLVALVPIFFIIHLPMQLYVFVAGVLIYKQKQRLQYLLMGYGFVSVLLSLMLFNISGMGSLPWFVELVISLLLVAISLQRLSAQVNFYLVLSPFLLMVLALFFFTSIVSLFYTLFELFIFSALFLLHSMKKPIFEGLRVATVLFFISLPAIIVLFLFFPRISFERGDFGFSQDKAAVKGLDGAMSLDRSALEVLSSKKMMEIEFFEQIPKENELYFRGSTLYEKKEDRWIESKLQHAAKPLIEHSGEVSYQVTLQPHYNHFLYTLDYPLKATNKSSLSSGYTLYSDQAVVEEISYEMQSATNYLALDLTPHESLSYDSSANLQTQKLLQPLRQMTKKQRFSALLELFDKQQLDYTLDPPEYEMQNFVDSFFVHQKSGYCVHFASAFATMARMLDIPSRVVTGFVGKYENMVENYLIIRQRDAHAWVEVHLDERGWVRVDPTVFAASNLTPQERDTRNESLYLHLNYIKYKIQRWVLYYDYLFQREFFTNLATDMQYLLKFVALIVVLLLMGVAIFVMLRKRRCGSKAQCLMQRLLKKLAKKGIVWDKKRSLHRFLLAQKLYEIDVLYHKIEYAKTHKKGDEKRLQELIKQL
ncbi:MAG: transglutaminaseTgpA domain-containing protein [Campylobacterota bacterium]